MNPNRTPFLAAAAAIPLLLAARPAFAHCQVPCGIYDHPARIAALKEDAATITKAIAQIVELAAKQDAQSFNQAARWTATKEEHASHIIETVSEYFLTQVVKPVAAGGDERAAYLETLAACHAAMVAAMKTKQQCDPAAATALDAAIPALDERW